jgi:2-keto-myo-inositol isomerase
VSILVAASQSLRFALNHMVAPQLDLATFFALARDVGLTDVEIRNDVAGQAILDGTPASEVKALAAEAGVTIVTINALQKFNFWDSTREMEAIALVDYAKACGAAALILVPANDGTGREDGVRLANAKKALAGLKPILADRGITGLVECLGFEICSLRKKSEAVEAIDAVDGEGVFKLTHDTFHHALADEDRYFPASTGLVHLSGVTDPGLKLSDMRDAHRLLVDARDRLDNIGQMRRLLAGGYGGVFSFEPFSDELRALSHPATEIGASLDFIRTELRAEAA